MLTRQVIVQNVEKKTFLFLSNMKNADLGGKKPSHINSSS